MIRWRGCDGASLPGLGGFGKEVAVASGQLAAGAGDGDLEAVPGVVGFEAVDGEFEKVKHFGRRGELGEAGVEVVAVVEEGSAGAVGEFAEGFFGGF